jgi:hypothetical protein
MKSRGGRKSCGEADRSTRLLLKMDSRDGESEEVREVKGHEATVPNVRYKGWLLGSPISPLSVLTLFSVWSFSSRI